MKQQATATSFKELGEATPFVYGKINNLYTLQLGYGQEQVILPGVVEGNMSVGFRWSAGLQSGYVETILSKTDSCRLFAIWSL